MTLSELQQCQPLTGEVAALAADWTAGRILVVEDDHDQRQLITTLLETAGYQVTEAADGAEALRVAVADPPDLVVSDCSMPTMDGFEMCTRLREVPAFEQTPVVFLTMLDAPENVSKGYTSGGVDYVCKPVNRTELLYRVGTHLELARHRRRLARQTEALQLAIAAQETQLEDVRDGQRALLAQPADFPNLKTAVRFQPALQAGGDFYDIVQLSDQTHGCLVADVAGHDLSLAYLTGALKALTAGFVNPALSIAETLVMMNSALRTLLSGERFVTAIYARYAAAEGQVELGGAGHPAALFQPVKSDSRYVDLPGDVLGAFDEARFGVATFGVQPGDRLWLYTDGLTDGCAPNTVDGKRRLQKVLDALREEPLEVAADRTVATALQASGGIFDDDVLLLGLEC